MTAAIEATKQYLDDIKAAVDEHALRLLFGVGPTLAVAMDTTGSMGPVINIARNTAINIARSRVGTADEPSLYVVSSFNDPGTGPLTVTSKLDVFEATVNGLFPYAGGDCPELMMTGMLDALNVMEKGSTLFAFTDAAPKDVDLESSVIATAADKYINIYIFKYDSFCDDGIDSSGGGGGLRKRVDSLSDRAYSEICAATGGQYFSGPVAEVAKIGDILDTLITGESSAILRVQDSLAAGETKTFDVPVDSYMKKVTFSLQGVGASLAVTQPDGAPLPASGVAGVVVTTLSDSTFISVSPPTPGIYKVAVTSQAGSSFSLICMGNSPLYLSSFNFASVRGRAGHTGWYALPAGTPPPFNQKIGVVSELAGPIGPSSGVVFSLRSPSFAPIVANAGLSSGSGEGRSAAEELLLRHRAVTQCRLPHLRLRSRRQGGALPAGRRGRRHRSRGLGEVLQSRVQLHAAVYTQCRHLDHAPIRDGPVVQHHSAFLDDQHHLRHAHLHGHVVRADCHALPGSRQRGY